MQTTYHDKWMISKATEKFSGFATLAGAAFWLVHPAFTHIFRQGCKAAMAIVKNH